MSRQLPSFDLVVATVDRTEELGRFLDSIRAQEGLDVRVVVVDQNADDRVAHLLAGPSLRIEHVRSPRGLSRARNAGIGLLAGDLVAFPDDDCAYPPGLLERVSQRFVDEPALGGLTGRVEDDAGHASSSWKRDPAILDRENVWNRVNSAATFLRRDVITRVGAFDERLGLGSGEPWSSGEEVDYVIRALDAGARIAYDPSVVVRHPTVPDDPRIGYRDGATVGYLLRKHAYPRRTVGRMLVRPAGGAVASLARLDPSRSRYHLATLRGRLRGYAARS